MEYPLIPPPYHDFCPLTFGQEDCGAGHGWGPAPRNCYLIHHVLAGKGVFHREGEEYHISAGQCFVVVPNQIIDYCADEEDPWHYVWITFDTTLPLPARMTAPVITSPTVARLMSDAHDALRHGALQPEILLCAMLWQMYSHFAAKDTTFDRRISHTDALMRYAKNIIDLEYMQDISVASLAERLHLERSYFSALFKKQFGMSPQTYLVEYRLNTAKDLICNYGYTPGEAGKATGYSDPCNFSRMFKRRFGVTPGEAKKMS